MENDINLQINSLEFKPSLHLGSVYTRFFIIKEKKKRKKIHKTKQNRRLNGPEPR